MLVIIPIQIVVFSITKIPGTVPGWFTLFHTNPVVGFFHSDFFILINNILIAVIYLALYHTLKDTDKGLLQAGIMLGLTGIAAYISSNKTFELLSLSKQYFSAPDEQTKNLLEAAGKASLASWQGTAFNTYYVLNGIALLIISILMYKSTLYSKATATWGLLSAVFMMVPSTAGIIGLVCSLISLIPWYVFSIRYAVVFGKLAKPPVDPNEQSIC
jgi:F0F1-type ATP synthase membrane subunit c/vacuolar-type H+-ATPase subunit K